MKNEKVALLWFEKWYGKHNIDFQVQHLATTNKHLQPES